MGQNLLDLLKSFGDLISSMGLLGGSLFLLCLVFILALGIIACKADLSGKGPDHWSHHGDVHNWNPRGDF